MNANVETTFSEFISFLETLSEDDWSHKVNSQWTVKDVVAHLVGWEKGAAEALKKNWLTNASPWFLETADFAEFNAKNVEQYKNYSPEELLVEWKRWQQEMDYQIRKIGKEKIRAAGPKWGWVFDDNHYKQHLNQIKKALHKI